MRLFPNLRLAAVTLVALSALPALAVIDDASTAPGQGGPDGLDDIWQSLYDAWGYLPGGDNDKDGCSNYIECVAGTNPNLAGDCLAVGNTYLAGNTVVFSFDAKKGKEYQVWQSSNPGGAAPGQPGSPWTALAGASKMATADAPSTIVITKPAGSSKFYRIESKDHDTDNDGLSDWAEDKVGTDINVAASPTNASGGVASDADTMRSLLSLSMTTSTPDAFEKEGTAPVIRLKREFGTMPLNVQLATEPGTTIGTKSNAAPSDFVIKNMANIPTTSITLPANTGLTAPQDVAKVVPVLDVNAEVPEALKVCLIRPSLPSSVVPPDVTLTVKDANPANIANRQLFVAFLGREEDVISTASGYATALVDGDNNSASISIVFNNLSSEQNTAYIRVGSDLEVLPLPLGQVAGAGWNIRAAQTEVTDQAMLNALRNGRLYVAISTANNPVKEIYGYFNRTTGTVTFDPTRTDLDAAPLGDPAFPVPTGDNLERDIWRFMTQSTFGGTTAMYNEIRGMCDAAIAGGGTYLDGLSAWLDKQMDPVQSPQISLRQLCMAADMEEFALRGNKPITYNSDPSSNGGFYGVSFVNGMPMGNTGNIDTNAPGQNYPYVNGSDYSPNKRREWWTMVTQSKDSVRQRVALALHEICVISERDSNTGQRAYGAANYWDMLAAGAFGKYRTLLENVTLNPMMGIYLTSMSNRATYDAGGGVIINPDENYAREVMQLFSIGLVLRHPDGSLQLSTEGLPIPTYDNTDITELARVFTGFSHGARHGSAITQVLQQNGGIANSTQSTSPTVYPNGSGNNIWFGTQNGHLYWAAPWTTPMKVIGRIGTTVYHDYNTYSYMDNTQSPPVPVTVPGVSKRLLAGKHGQLELPVWSPTGKTDTETHAQAALEVSRAHDSLAGVASDSVYGAGTQASPGHTNTPVNICRWLIQRLVTSNPSAGYIYRVQNAYRASNGTLGPVIKAILLDQEARSLVLADELFAHGKVKEPLVHFAAILRQFRAFSGAPVANLRDMQTGFSDLDAPLTGGLAPSEVAKFNDANLSPPSKPAAWPDGPFRLRFDSLRNSLGQSPQDAPTVFNWFLPDYRPAGSFAALGITAPELMISNEANEVAKVNFLYNCTWMTLAGMSTTPGMGGADFIFRNGWATPAARVSTNGGTSFLGWPPTITLNETNWNTGITLTFAPINDQKIDQIAASNIRFGVTSNALGYNGVASQAIPVTFVENEKKNESLVVTQTGGNTWVQEGGMTDSFSVYLSCPPAVGSSVTVDMASQFGEVVVSPASLTFDSTTWNVPQTVSVTAIDDTDIENAGTNNDQLILTTTSTSANFNGIITAPIMTSLVDNDNGVGVLINQTGGSTDLAETSSTTLGSAGFDSYTIVLTKAPTANVTVNVVSNGQIGIHTTGTTFTQGTATRVFTTANWMTPQTVNIRGNNDTTAEGPHTGTITHTIAAASGEYLTTLPIQQIVATIGDDDNSIILTHSDTETRVLEGEINGSDTLTVRLRTIPTAATGTTPQVSVTLGAEGLRFSPAVLTFNASGSSLWNVDQVVTVTALDDHLNKGLVSRSIIAYSTSNGTNYNGTTSVSLPATIVDNDDSRLLIDQSGGSTFVNEDGTTDSYTLSLARRPDVGSTTTVSLVVGAGITVSPSTTVTFTDSNWNTPQTITVSAANDGSAEPRSTATIIHNISSTDATYNVVSTPYVVVTIDDNDPALNITQTNIFTQVREGGTTGTGGTPNLSDTFTVSLPRAPGAATPVTVNVVASSQVTVSPATLTFTSTNSGTAQTVTVTAVDDTNAEPSLHQGLVTFNIASADSYYNGAQSPPVQVQVTDNDSPGVSFVESSGTTTTTEGSTTTDSYTAVLTQAPTSNVDVVVAGGTQSLLSKSGTPNLATVTLNFTPANWATAQTVSVLPVNDTLPELRHLAPITHTISTTDVGYAALGALPSVGHIITDNDNTVATNRVRITESSNFTSVTESTTTDTFTVVLSQQPTDTVTITFAPDSQIAVSPSTLTFVPGATGAGTFNVAQTVTVRAVDDHQIEPVLHWGILNATVTSTDTVFSATPVTPVTVSCYDNDGPRMNLVATGGSTVLTESPSGQNPSDSYSIVLDTAPTADVVVTITPDVQVTTSASTLTFTPTNWNIEQSVTVTAVDDTLAETVTHLGSVAHSVASADPMYHNIGLATVNATIWDNDSAGLNVSPVGGTDTVLTEGGTTPNDAVLVKLNTQPEPGTSVTVTIYPPMFYVPPPQIGKASGYFTSDQGGSNQRDNIVIDYTESILHYRSTFYASINAAYPSGIPTNLATSTNAGDLVKIQNAHWAATKAVIDKMDLWFCTGSLRAKFPVLIEPNQPTPVPMPAFNPRQAIMDAIYRHSGGSGSPATTRYAPEVAYNPKTPPTATFDTDIRDRVRWAGYLMTVGTNAFTSH